MLRPSFAQRMLSTFPHLGGLAGCKVVIGFHAPMGPAHTSGGSEGLSRNIAQVLPSLATERACSHQPRESVSGLRHNVLILPLVTPSVAMELAPSTLSSRRSSWPPGCQVSQLMEA